MPYSDEAKAVIARMSDAKQMAELAGEVAEKGYDWKQRALKAEQELRDAREKSAKIVEQTLHEMHLQDRQWARAAILFASRAVRRGRHLTAKEKLENFTKAMAACVADEGEEA
jgi:hypothetical protein